ncbi:hypothetical protein FNO01nite_15700 [Flavobacterium noncentrifugens]|uniref:BlaR1 peptidase M56 n=1 Tax=Flavobacterium noncentrifugens TaxID=1128970 RepID=A0A1G8WF08_9FLAO|nr:M56 family metallopeptidase [Flavobacterium noncentrifugens]GEP50898.1 hypothetical protein FNO01nite_15700 [Flavobacterium noncentrifugens]SDJ76821.1 BlaR1 peptidase M56 [Flavobacterium noncentrifugens]
MVNDMLLKAISWTLVHSVWQGFLLAFFAGLVILLTKKSTSALRYNILAGLFVGFLVVSGLTFNYEFQNQNAETITRLNLPVQDLQLQFGQTGATIIYSDYSQIIIDFLNHNANFIVLIWFLIFSIRCFGIFGNLSYIYRIRNYKTQAPSQFWQDKIAELATRIKLHKTIVLLESRLVKVPSVTGFMKPMILIPAGLLANLPQDQIEAILLHELAHIRRKDYAINILQSFAEILFFFNPGLLWVSSILRDERENCCDDIAISATENKSGFVHALVSFEEYNLKNNSLAMGFGKSKNHLLNRAKRIIYDNNKTLNSIEKTLLSVSLVAIAVILVACSNRKMMEIPFESPISSRTNVAYEKQIFEADQAAAKADLFAQQADIQAAAAVCKPEEADAVAAQADAEVAQADFETAKADAIAAQADFIAKQTDVQAKQANAQLKRVEAAAKPQKAEKIRTTTSTTTTVTGDQPEKVQRSVVHVITGITGNDLPSNIDVDQLTNNIISDLISEKIINTNNNLSYLLSHDALIVNGVKQPQNLQSKLSTKYVKSKDISIAYNYEYNTKTSAK